MNIQGHAPEQVENFVWNLFIIFIYGLYIDCNGTFKKKQRAWTKYAGYGGWFYFCNDCKKEKTILFRSIWYKSYLHFDVHLLLLWNYVHKHNRVCINMHQTSLKSLYVSFVLFLIKIR